MARLYSQIIEAPSGMDITSDPVTMPLGRWPLLINYQLDRSGLIHRNVNLVNVLPLTAVTVPQIDGVAYYYQARLSNIQHSSSFTSDILIFVANALLQGVLIPTTTDLFIYEGTGVTGYSLAGAFFIGKRVRAISYHDEMIFVQEDGLIPIRFYASENFGAGFYRAGIEPPNVTGGTFFVPALIIDAVGAGLTGTWQYKLTFADERFRESSPTEELEITLANEGTRAKYDTGYLRRDGTPQYGGSNIRYAYLYRNTVGTPDTFYQIARAAVHPFAAMPVTFRAADFYFNPSAQDYDFAPDTSIVGSTLCPSPGENDPPAPASVGIVYRNHIVLNDVTDANVIQISNLSSTVQYTLVPSLPLTVTDGLRSSIGTDQGNVVTAFANFGSYLAIFKRRGCFYLSGNSLVDFSLQPMHNRGCIAPDSCVRCDNVVMFLSDDGVYAASYQGGEVVTKVSKEIEEQLDAIAESFKELAVGWYIGSCYHLAIRDTVFVYNFDAQGWSTYQFGSDQINLGNGAPRIGVHSGVGFTVQGVTDSGLFGSYVPPDGLCPEDNCDIDITPTSVTASSAGGSFPITVLAHSMARILYSASDAWLRVTGPNNGSGTATLVVDENTSCMARSGNVTICENLVSVDQDAGENCCDVDVMPASFPALTSDPSSQQIDVTLNNSMVPSASTDVSWLHVSNYHVVTPTTGYFTVSVDQCPSCTERTGNVMICDIIIPFTQPFSVVGGSASISAAAQSIRIDLSGDNFLNWPPYVNAIHPSWPFDIFSDIGQGAYGDAVDITHTPTYAEPWIIVRVPANLSTTVGNPGYPGEAVVYFGGPCSGPIFSITQGFCMNHGSVGTPINQNVSGLFAYTITLSVPNSGDPIAGYSSASFGFTSSAGGTAAFVTFAGDTVGPYAGGSTWHCTPAQLAAINAAQGGSITVSWHGNGTGFGIPSSLTLGLVCPI